MAKMRWEEENLQRGNQAFIQPAAAPATNPRTAAAPAAASAASPVTEESALQAAKADKDTALSGLWNGPVDEPMKFPEASATGFYTSEGLPIESSYGLASNFWSQIGINNILDQTPSGAMSYQGYLAYNGITDPRMTYRRNLDAAQEMYARAIGTYGASGEGLAQGNLADAGYSRYLTGLAYQQKVANTMQAQSQLRQDLAQTAMQYQKYIQDYNAANGIDDLTGEAAGNDETAPGVLNETQASALQYLKQNGITNEADIETARIALRNQGYSDADIDVAIAGWQAEDSSDLLNRIRTSNYLSVGGANYIRDAYGENSDIYAEALAELQKRNAELVSSAVDAIISDTMDSEDFLTLISDIRSSTESTDKKGEVSYKWDEMGEGDRIRAIKDRIQEMFKNGDITRDTYNEANYRIVSSSIDTDADKKKTFGAGKMRLTNILEDYANILVDPESVSEEQRQSLVQQAASKIEVKSVDLAAKSARGYKYYTPHITISVNGKDVTFDGQYVGENTDGYQEGLFVKNGVPYYGKNGQVVQIISSGDHALTLTDPQKDAFIEILNFKASKE